MGLKDTGYLSVYFRGYGVLSILLPGIWDNHDQFLLPGNWDTVLNISVYFQGCGLFMNINYGDICRDMGYLPFTSRDK